MAEEKVKRTRKPKVEYQRTIYDNKYVKNIYNVEPVLSNGTNFPVKDGKINESFDDFIIPCNRSKCGFIYTSHGFQDSNEILVGYITSTTVSKDILSKFSSCIIKYFDNEEKGRNNETEFYFLDKDLDKFAKIVKAQTSGAKTSPFMKGVVS